MESLIHHSRIKSLLEQMKTDTSQIKAYLNIHITGKLTPSITDPVHLKSGTLADKQTFTPKTFLT